MNDNTMPNQPFDWIEAFYTTPGYDQQQLFGEKFGDQQEMVSLPL
jgi:hypothetical protein